jgi:hypothetical protein
MMVDHVAALKAAIDLLQMPRRVALLRGQPLPAGVEVLLQLAVGDQPATRRAAELTGRSAKFLQEAAAFFIEQVLLHPEADSYRVLGAGSGASSEELRRNMALLLRWLHPDQSAEGMRTVLASRVTNAWNSLKTPDRKAAYDRSKRLAQASSTLDGKMGRRAPAPRAARRPKQLRPKMAKAPHVLKAHGMGLLRRFMLLFGRVIQ